MSRYIQSHALKIISHHNDIIPCIRAPAHGCWVWKFVMMPLWVNPARSGTKFSTATNKFPKKKKVKCTLVQALRLSTGRMGHRGSRGIALLFLDHGTRSGWGLSVTPRPPFTPGKDPVPIVQYIGWPQDQAGQVRKISPPSEFGPQTVQFVASRYTDWATRPTYPLLLYFNP